MAFSYRTVVKVKRRLPMRADESLADYDFITVPAILHVDLFEVAQRLGQKAYDNKSGVAKLMGGLIKVNVSK